MQKVQVLLARLIEGEELVLTLLDVYIAVFARVLEHLDRACRALQHFVLCLVLMRDLLNEMLLPSFRRERRCFDQIAYKARALVGHILLLRMQSFKAS
jgi:hypothetical protein